MATMRDEIVLPITESETEWILGQAVQKMSQTYDHAEVQALVLQWLRSWARGRGRAVPEWRFRIAPPGEPLRPLIPDVAYLAYERAAGVTAEELQVPAIAPDIVVEILSPNDRPNDVAEKICVYRAAGVTLVLLVDPRSRTVERFDADDTSALVTSDNALVAAFPKLTLPYGKAFFASLDEGFGPESRIGS